jgi:TonB family protein
VVGFDPKINLKRDSNNNKQQLEQKRLNQSDFKIRARTPLHLRSPLIQMVMTVLVITLCVGCASSGSSATDLEIPVEELDITDLNSVDSEPELVDGWLGVMRDIRYPEEARREGVEGEVYIRFIVDKNGYVRNPEVIQGIGHGCDEEAVRVISRSKFHPAMKDGEPVHVEFTVPISFRLSL